MNIHDVHQDLSNLNLIAASVCSSRIRCSLVLWHLVLLQELRGILRRKLTGSGSLREVTQEGAVGTIAKLTRLSEFHRSVDVPRSELPFRVPMTSRAVLVAEAAE